MATIGLVHVDLEGHFNPANRLGAELVRQGHRVLAWGQPHQRHRIETIAGNEFRALGTFRQEEIRGGWLGFSILLARAVEACSGQLIEEMFQAGVELVVYDCHARWGKLAAEFLGIPAVISDPTFPWGFHTTKLRAPSYFPGPPADLPWAAGLAEFERCRTAVGRRWDHDLGSWPSSAYCCGGHTLRYTVPSILSACPTAVTMPSDWHLVGPLMTSDSPSESVSAKDGSPPHIYVALGTFYNGNTELFRSVIAALADTDARVIISTGRGSVHPRVLEPMPANVTATTWVDSRRVLRKAQLHVTHGGCGSIHESLLAGVPMVLVPQAQDNLGWAQSVCALGAGRMGSLSHGELATAIDSVLHGENERARAQEVGVCLREYPGAARLADAISQALA